MDSPRLGAEPKASGIASPAVQELPHSPAAQMDSPKPALQISQKGIENAKKRLRAFSIQKKSPIAGVKASSPKAGTSAPTVVIGKLLSTTKAVPKPLPKPSVIPDTEELKKPKPPKPGNTVTYMDLKKKTLGEINDMKRKMELVELGIPLGLICPAANSPASKAMPTKAMPPIKSFLAPEQLDEIISEAKKARAEGRVFKFDYSKLLPDYDNPFLNKKKEEEMAEKIRIEERERQRASHGFKPLPKREDWIKRKQKERERDKERRKDKSKERSESKSKSDNDSERSDKPKETDVNLNDYLVCDSWSIDNDDKTDTNSPQVDLKKVDKEKPAETIEDPMRQLREGLMKTKQAIEENIAIENKKEESASLLKKKEQKIKMAKLKPVIDSFTYEIDVDDDEPILDMFTEDSNDENSDKKTETNVKNELIDQDTPDSKENENTNDFLESIISEIKHEVESDGSPGKCLVAYDPSPDKNGSVSCTPQTVKSGSVTPELDDKARSSSRYSNYSETSYKTSESGYKSSESGPKSSKSSDKSTKSSKRSVESLKVSERDYKSRDTSCESNKSRDKSTDSIRSSDSFIHADADNVIQKETSQVAVEESLETWSFVMKICQPLLFRHDRNKCYRETKAQPRLWYTETPKLCSCVKDRSIVYEELQRCKMTLVDKLYLSDNVSEQGGRNPSQWYPVASGCLLVAAGIQLSSEWETEDPPPPDPQLHQEYQRFMESVWPDIAEPTAASTTPTREDPNIGNMMIADDTTSSKIKKKRQEDEMLLERKPKKMKVASQDWSQDSEIDEEEQKSAKKKSNKVKDKARKRKRSISPDSNSDIGKGKTKGKKKDIKRLKAKMGKQRRLEKKYLKKLKDKQKKEKKNKKVKTEKIEMESEMEKEKEIQKKLKKKKKKVKKAKLKKRDGKRKRDLSSSSDSSDSDSDGSDKEQDKRKQRAQKKMDAKKKKDKRKKKRKQSTSESAQSEELFDVNILNNIKTEKIEEKSTKTTDIQEFSPRRQQLKPRQEIINMKELQNDLGCRSLDIKQESVCKDSPKDVATENESISSQSLDDTSVDKDVVKEQPQAVGQPIKSLVDDSNQSISQESISISLREQEGFEPDTSHLRPSSQNSNYSFHDVLNQRDQSNFQANQTDYQPTKNETEYPKNHDDYPKNQNDYSTSQNDYSASQNEYSLSQNDFSTSQSDYTKSQSDYTKNQSDYSSGHEGDYKEYDKDTDSGHNEVMGNYEMYEEMAMEYQNNVASQSEASNQVSPLVDPRGSRIETVVSRGEIKCDWRAGDAVWTPGRPSRWGLKPGEANIVLTGQTESAPADQVYPIRSVLEDSTNYTERRAAKDSSYDEAYNALFGASDRLEYGDCFPHPSAPAPPATPSRPSTLHQRIELVLQTTVLGEVASEGNDESDQNKEDKGILLNKSASESGGAGSTRAVKRVSFADGYKPGQDSDTEAPPKKKRRRGTGCPWPCPASHPAHVPLWDALPPPRPPPGSPPPRRPPPHCPHPPFPTHDLRHGHSLPPPLRHHMQKIDPMVQLPGLLADPPPGLMSTMPPIHHHIPM